MVLAEALVRLNGGAMAEELRTEQGTVARDMAIGNSFVLETVCEAFPEEIIS